MSEKHLDFNADHVSLRLLVLFDCRQMNDVPIDQIFQGSIAT